MVLTAPTHNPYGLTATNLGPLMTTFTPPATCTGIDAAGRGKEALFNGDTLLGPVRCNETPYIVHNDCVPPPQTTAGYSNFVAAPYSYLTYHSPGVVCPSGWMTAASYASATPTSYRDVNDEFIRQGWPFEEEETLILCCPENFNGGRGNCLGPPETAARAFTGYCVTTTDPDASRSASSRAPTTAAKPVTAVVRLGGEEDAQLRAWAEPVYMVHRPADMARHSAAAAQTTTVGSGAETSAKETGAAEKPKKNAAGSIGPCTFWMTAVALMAAVVA